MLKSLVSLLGFLGGFVLMCTGLQYVAPFPQVPQVREKLEFFAKHSDQFDTLFLGSSRIYRQVSPALFDAEMRTREISTRSFNFGIDAMTTPELLYVFDQILETRPKNLRHVIVDLNPFRRVAQGTHDPDGLRSVYWHDFEYTAMVLRAVWKGKKSRLLPRVLQTWEHVSMLVKKYTHLGDGTHLLSQAGRVKKREDQSPVLGASSDGFFPRNLQMPDYLADEYSRALRKRLRAGRKVNRSPEMEEALAEFVRKVELQGARTYFLVAPIVGMPVVLEPGHLPWSRNGNEEPTLLHFDDPEEFPELYEVNLWFDMQHLNTKGATLFTKVLAEHLAPHMSRNTDRGMPSTQTQADASTPAPLAR